MFLLIGLVLISVGYGVIKTSNGANTIIDKIKNKLEKAITIKNTSFINITLNFICAVLGLIYLLFPIYNVVWDVFGVILLVTLFSNLFLMYLMGFKLNKNNDLGKKLNLLSYIFIFTNSLFIIFMGLGNVLISITYSNQLSANIPWYFFIILGYYGILVFGAIMSFLNLKNLDNKALWDLSDKGDGTPEKRARLHKYVKVGMGIGSAVFLGAGCYCAGLIMFGSVSSLIGDTKIGGILSGIIMQFGLFFAFAMIGSVIVLLKLLNRKTRPKVYYAVGILGIIITGIFLAPLVTTPISVLHSETSFQGAFGVNSWNVQNANFMVSPFSLPGYFLGIPPKDCTVIEHVEYYYNATQNIRLYFDAYIPPAGQDLPGKNSTIIKIHGGGWKGGDKGFGNMMQVNKYLASQGYVVFDIQYGLIRHWEPSLIPTPAYKVGDITVDDQIQHIGNFSQYIGLNNATYGANLDSVFFMGASAGGHLACASALGIWSGNYTHIFGTNLTVKGIIPIYPGNNHVLQLGFQCSTEFANPVGFINSSSPPSLVFQGTQDGLVHPAVTLDYQNTYMQQGSTKCAIVWAHASGHGADFYFTGHGNQVFMYYLERFLYLCVNGVI